MAPPLINVARRAKRGDILEIKTLIGHHMLTGYQSDEEGNVIPRDIIHLFVCTYNGEEVFRAELFPAIAANPFISFTTRATESGRLDFAWTPDTGEIQRAFVDIVVED